MMKKMKYEYCPKYYCTIAQYIKLFQNPSSKTESGILANFYCFFYVFSHLLKPVISGYDIFSKFARIPFQVRVLFEALLNPF
jgi:hypothetical protein